MAFFPNKVFFLPMMDWVRLFVFLINFPKSTRQYRH